MPCLRSGVRPRRKVKERALTLFVAGVIHESSSWSGDGNVCPLVTYWMTLMVTGHWRREKLIDDWYLANLNLVGIKKRWNRRRKKWRWSIISLLGYCFGNGLDLLRDLLLGIPSDMVGSECRLLLLLVIPLWSFCCSWFLQEYLFLSKSNYRLVLNSLSAISSGCCVLCVFWPTQVFCKSNSNGISVVLFRKSLHSSYQLKGIRRTTWSKVYQQQKLTIGVIKRWREFQWALEETHFPGLVLCYMWDLWLSVLLAQQSQDDDS